MKPRIFKKEGLWRCHGRREALLDDGLVTLIAHLPYCSEGLGASAEEAYADWVARGSRLEASRMSQKFHDAHVAPSLLDRAIGRLRASKL